jgi:hypothetical protein
MAEIVLSVYRRLDNRSEGLPDDSPRAFELHLERKIALHEALDSSNAWEVRNWGETNSEESHELVEILLSIVQNPHVLSLAGSAAAWIGLEIAKAGLGEIETQAVKALLARLIPQQKQNRILDFTITLQDGTWIRCNPDGKLEVFRQD